MKTSLEKIIPLERLIVYATVIPCCFVVAALLWADSTITSAEDQKNALVLLGEKIKRKSAAQEANRQILEQYRNKDPLFLHRCIEPMALLSAETSILRARLAKSALPDDGALEKRLNGLNADNSFCFVEGTTETASGWKETAENQNKTVEIDSDDLARVLAVLEGAENQDHQRPHMFISEARLDRKKGTFQETWGLSLKIVRREYQ